MGILQGITFIVTWLIIGITQPSHNQVHLFTQININTSNISMKKMQGINPLGAYLPLEKKYSLLITILQSLKLSSMHQTY